MKNIFFVICLLVFLVGEASAGHYSAVRIDEVFVLDNVLTIVLGENTKSFPLRTRYGVITASDNEKVVIFEEVGKYCNTNYIVSDKKYNIIKGRLENSLHPVKSFDPSCSYTKKLFIN